MADYMLDKDITLNKLDYAYIDKCSDQKELERILHELRSGREGYYPDLIKHCEKKLESINPNSRVLRKPQPALGLRDLKPEEFSEINEDLQSWEREMTELNKPKIDTLMVNGHGDHNGLPPVRSTKALKGNKKEPIPVEPTKKTNPKRIKSSDYKAWDKFDADAECEKLEESTELSANSKTLKNAKVQIPDKIDATGLTEEEKEYRAMKEKDKGNEAFKAGDFEEALSYYSRSISLLPTAASFNNRALVYLRLEKWKEAKTDCNKVLSIRGEEGNLKAKLRRATANKSLGNFKESTDDLGFVLAKEPNNVRAKSIMKEIEKLQENETDEHTQDEDTPEEDIPVKPGKTMVITEVDGDSDEEEEEEVEIGKEDSINFQDAQSREVAASREEDSQTIAHKEEYEEEEESASTSIKQEEKEQRQPEPVTPLPSPTEPKFPPEADRLKSQAAQFFKTGQYDEAGTSYTKAIESMNKFLKTNTTNPEYDLALAVLYNNRAACWLKQGNDRACIDDCATVLDIKPWDVKALMRRGAAYEHMEKYALAYIDYKGAESIDWNNSFAQTGANRVASHLRQIYGKNWREKIPEVPFYPHRNKTAGDVGKDTKIEEIPKDEKPFSSTANEKTETEQKPVQNTTVKPEEKENVNITTKKTRSVDTGDKPVVQDQKIAAEKAKASSAANSASREDQKPRPTSKKARRNRRRTSNKSHGVNAKAAKDREDEETAKKKEKIKRDLFDTLKGQGNEHVKKGQYSLAIDCYTRCITLCPKETASYTNRALCFLKLQKNVSAANDCTEAIKLDPVNIKAFYRRSQARKAEGMYKDAERDIKKLLEIDPGNKPAKNELNVLGQLIADNAVKQAATKSKEETKTGTKSDPILRKSAPHVPKKTMVIEEVSSSSDEGEFILPEEKPIEKSEMSVKVASKPPEKPENPPAMPLDKESSKEGESNQEDINSVKAQEVQKPSEKSISAEKLEKGGAIPKRDTKKSPIRPKIPKGKQLTPFEFGSLWNAITDKSDVGTYREILDTAVPSRLPELISNKIDDHVISVIAKVALLHIEEGDPQRGYEMMLYLSESNRFGMAAMFLSDEDKETLRRTFTQMLSQKDDSYSRTELEKLMKVYNLK